MKKGFLVFIALIAMATVANATSYTGTVSNIHMGSKTPADVSGITFNLDGNVLTGNFDVPDMFPPHHIDLTANVNGTCPNASGTVTVYGEEVTFTGCVTNVSVTKSNLSFHFEGETATGVQVSFDFSGTNP
jgi:hypothetical protein